MPPIQVNKEELNLFGLHPLRKKVLHCLQQLVFQLIQYQWGRRQSEQFSLDIEPECNTHNVGDCVLVRCLLFSPILFWKVDESDGKKQLSLLLEAWIFLKEACCNHIQAILLWFLIYIFNLYNKIIKINAQFQTIEMIGLCAADKSCYNLLEQGCDHCHQFVSETRNRTIAQLDFLFLLKKCTTLKHTLSTWPWNAAWWILNSGTFLLPPK